MSKLIGLLIILIAGAIGYALYNYFQDVKNKQAEPQKEEMVEVIPTSLSGMPYQLEESLSKAQAQGYKGMKEWMRAFGPQLQDPRRAWIELDYVVLMSSQDPGAAKKLFNQVKDRTPTTSPVYPRIKKLEKTYE